MAEGSTYRGSEEISHTGAKAVDGTGTSKAAPGVTV